MPLPDVDLRIVDLDDATRELPAGEPGEILIAAPQLMRGYWNQPDETSAVFSTDANGTRWLHTGDIGYVDEDGYLFITDRKKELIKVSGFQVWPREVEEAIASHPAVLEAGVAPVIDPGRGEVPKAWVVLRAGHSATGPELRAFCREKLAAYKVPAQVAIVRELPKTPVGKVLRRKLKELDQVSR
jgi:long-chain acyl-CoA synthetase